MAIAFINLTQNRDDFEDKLVEDLSTLLPIPTTVTAAAGIELLNVLQIGDDTKVLVIVAHASSDGDETSLDLGFDFDDGETPDFLETPDVLAGILPMSDTTRCVVFYCACSALSPATLAAHSDSGKVVGSIASDKPLDGDWRYAIADLLMELHNLDLDQPAAPLRSQMQQVIERNEADFKLGMGFRYTPNLMTEEE